MAPPGHRGVSQINLQAGVGPGPLACALTVLCQVVGGGVLSAGLSC